jgi:hypothetical protein
MKIENGEGFAMRNLTVFSRLPNIVRVIIYIKLGRTGQLARLEEGSAASKILAR